MAWQISVTSAAEKHLGKIHWQDAVKIRSAIDQMADNPFLGDAQKMTGKSEIWRRRVGSYRIFYKVFVSQKLVYIYEIARRTSKTY